MTTVNRSSAEYAPNGNAEFYVPVQQGSVRNLCPAVTPGGQGVLSWVDRTANELRCAVLPDVDAMFADNVVAPGDVRMVWSSGTRTLHTGSIAVIGGELLAFVSHRLTTNGRVECYVADDPEDPTSWALRGTVQTHTAPNPPGTLSNQVGGVPTVLPSGRWVLPYHSWLTFGGSALEDGIGIHYSDNQGATWVTPVNDRKGALLGGTAGPQASTVGYHPASGTLVMGAWIGSVAQWRVYASADGASWTNTELISGGLVPHFYMDDGAVLYAALLDGALDLALYEVADPTVVAGWTDLGEVGIDGATGFLENGVQVVPLWQGSRLDRVAFTSQNRIAGQPRAGWLVGQVGAG